MDVILFKLVFKDLQVCYCFICVLIAISSLSNVTGNIKVKSTTKFSKEQLQIMEVIYETNPFPYYSIRKKLAEDFNIDQHKVGDWFRARQRKEKERIGIYM